MQHCDTSLARESQTAKTDVQGSEQQCGHKVKARAYRSHGNAQLPRQTVVRRAQIRWAGGDRCGADCSGKSRRCGESRRVWAAREVATAADARATRALIR